MHILNIVGTYLRLNLLTAGRVLGGFSTYQSRRRSRLALATVNQNALAET